MTTPDRNNLAHSRWKCRLFPLYLLSLFGLSTESALPVTFYAETGGIPLRTIASNPANPAAACGSAGSISPKADYVVLTTYCSLDAANDSGGQDLYYVNVNDFESRLITKNINGLALGGNFFSQLIDVAMSNNRRWATFPSNRADIVGGAQNTDRQVYLGDIEANHLVRVTETISGVPGIGNSSFGFPSDDGSTVAIQTNSTNLIQPYPGAGTDNRFLFRNIPTGEFNHLPACGVDGGYLSGYYHSGGIAFLQQCIIGSNPPFGPSNLVRQSPNWTDIHYAFDEGNLPIEVWSARMAGKGGVVLFWEAVVVNGSLSRGNLYARLIQESRTLDLGPAQDALISADLSTGVVVSPYPAGSTNWFRAHRVDLSTGAMTEIPLGRSKLPGAPGFTWIFLYDIADDGQSLLMGLDSIDVSVGGDWLGGGSQRFAVMATADLSVIFSSGLE